MGRYSTFYIYKSQKKRKKINKKPTQHNTNNFFTLTQSRIQISVDNNNISKSVPCKHHNMTLQKKPVTNLQWNDRFFICAWSNNKWGMWPVIRLENLDYNISNLSSIYIYSVDSLLTSSSESEKKMSSQRKRRVEVF